MIIDKNNFQQTGTVKEIMNTDSLGNKWESFGWDVSEIDGHDINDIEKFFNNKSSKPKLLVANTVKGKGISFSENNNDWHHAVLTKNLYEKALKEIDSKNDTYYKHGIEGCPDLADSIFLTPTSKNPWDPYEVFCKKNVGKFTHKKLFSTKDGIDRCKNQRLIDSM